MAGNVTIDMSGAHHANLTDIEADIARIKWITRLLGTYVIPVIFSTGLIGNLLSFVVLMRSDMRSKSVYFYLLLLACADSAILFMGAFRTWFRLVFGWELYIHQSGASCKIHMFVFEVSLHMAAWLIVLVTVDRFIAVVYPLKAAVLCTSRRAAMTSLLCLVTFLLYHVHVFWTFGLQHFPNYSRTMCAPLHHLTFMHHGYSFLRFVTYSILPFVIVITLNSIIVYNIRRNYRNRKLLLRNKDLTSDQRQSAAISNKTKTGSPHARMPTGSSNRSTASNKMTTILFLISFSWLFLSLPFTLYSLVPIEYKGGIDPYYKEVRRLIKLICFFLKWTNHSINFFLYCLSGRKLRAMIQEQLCGTPTRGLNRSSTRISIMTAFRRLSSRMTSSHSRRGQHVTTPV